MAIETDNIQRNKGAKIMQIAITKIKTSEYTDE